MHAYTVTWQHVYIHTYIYLRAERVTREEREVSCGVRWSRRLWFRVIERSLTSSEMPGGKLVSKLPERSKCCGRALGLGMGVAPQKSLNSVLIEP